MVKTYKVLNKRIKHRMLLCMLILLGIMAKDRCFAEDLWISFGPGAGFLLGDFSDISGMNVDGRLGLDVAGLFGVPLEAGVDVSYARYLPSSDWVKNMNGLRGILGLGYHIPLGKRFVLVPGIGGGVQYLFVSSALDSEAYTAGSYTERSGVQALAKAGVGVRFSSAQNWSLGFDVDYFMTIEKDSRINGVTVALSFNRLVGMPGIPKHRSTPLSSEAQPLRSESDRLASALLFMEVYGNIRILRKDNIFTLVIEDSFAAYKTEPTERTLEQLDKILELLSGTSIRNMVISGYVADTSDGEEHLDLALSLARAEAVRDILAASGNTSLTTIEARGRGTADPVADNDTAEGMARNRRVELLIELEEENEE